MVKWRRYTQTSCQEPGFHFCQEGGTTECGRFTGANALSSKPGASAAEKDLPPKSQSASSESVRGLCKNRDVEFAFQPSREDAGCSAATAAQLPMNLRRENSP